MLPSGQFLPRLVFAVCLLFPKGISQGLECIDRHEQCERWASKQQCVANPFFMRRQCKKACDMCDRTTRDTRLTVGGYATEKGTRKFATMLPSVSRYAALGHFRKDTSMGTYFVPGQRVRGTPWLTLSSFGVGTYLGNPDEATNELVIAAIITSVYHGLRIMGRHIVRISRSVPSEVQHHWCWLQGRNVIDTARNYRNGQAEVAVGEALRVLQTLSGFTRHMIFVSTKAGFLETSVLQQLLSEGIDREEVKGGVNCIAPACLRASLDSSLQALNLKTIDLLYLHNAAEMSSDDVQTSPFWERLSRAFQWLETARLEGLIRAYGMATWTCFRVPETDPGFLSLQKVVQLAERIGGPNHGFRYIQVPINAGMLEAVEKPWQPLGPARSATLLQAAAELGVGVFASGPLGEGELLKNELLSARVNALAQLPEPSGIPGRLLQIVRSAPLLLSTVVGHKNDRHVNENLGLVRVKPLSERAFWKALADLEQGN